MKLLKGFPNSIWSIQPGWTVYNFYDVHVCHFCIQAHLLLLLLLSRFSHVRLCATP